MSGLETLICNRCGGELVPESGDTYRCACCGNLFAKKQEDFEPVLKKILGEEKYARASAARQSLWRAMHEEYVNSETCTECARELKLYVPSDYYADFAETANRKNDKEISDFLNFSSGENMEEYGDAVLDFMLKSLSPGTLTAVCSYIDRAFPDKSSETYSMYLNAYEREAEKVNGGIYEVTLPRDVFLAYSSSDMPKVLELCEYLEGHDISCFLAMRNLRHGRGAADNYDRALRTAMDSCRILLYVSSASSRKIGCDAYRIEIPYIRKKDLDGAPSEFRNASYEKIPQRYKKNRIEYLLDDYEGIPTDKAVKEFFAGYEWCRTKEDVADRAIKYLTSEPETDPHGRETAALVEKEKNVLTYVEKLISVYDFIGAKSSLSEIEKDEIRLWGGCTAAVYYYRILVDGKATSGEELVRKYAASGMTLRNDRNYRLAMSCADSPEKDRLSQIEEDLENALAGKETKRGTAAKTREDSRTAGSVREPEKTISPWSEGLRFERKGDGFAVMGIGSCEDTDLFIPPEFDGLPVTEIGEGAFFSRDLTSVVLPDTVEKIGSDAFSHCFSIMSVTIGKNVKEIGDGAFRFCEKLVEVCNLSSLDIIAGSEKHGHVSCYAKYIYAAGGESKIFTTEDGLVFYEDGGERVLLGCRGEKSGLVLPDFFKGAGYSVYRYAFYNRTSLTHVTIGKGVTKIGENAFRDCGKLVEVRNLSSLNVAMGSIGSGYVAYYAKNVVAKGNGKSRLYTDGEGFEFYEDGAFCCLMGYDGKATDVKLPGSGPRASYEIYRYAFSDCGKITDVSIPGRVTAIGEYAFWNCASLSCVKIPDTVTSVGSHAFGGCGSLSAVQLPNGLKSIESGLFWHCASLKSVTIPQSVDFIGEEAFRLCETLSYVVLPKSVLTIEDYAFSDCPSLGQVYFSGSEEEWTKVSVGEHSESFTAAAVCFYSESEPVKEGKFWHRDGNGNPVMW